MTLAARGVSFAWERGESPAVDGVDLRVGRGELVAVVGPNGAGKSTLLGLLSGWLTPRSGSVELEGKALDRWPARERARRLALLPQDAAPLYDLTVAEVVAMGRHPHRGAWAPLDARDRRVVAAVLAATDTRGLRHRRFATLSGGERQRVLLASVLAQEPAVLLLDEPTASLDLHHGAEVFRQLGRAAREGTGVLAVTHDLNLAALFADRVVLLARGRVAVEGAPSDVLTEEILRRVYGPELVVVDNPASGRPAVLPAPGAAR